MSTLHVLMPPLARTDGDPAFHRWLARGQRLRDVQHARATVLREQFRFAGDAIPAAALRHHCHGDNAGTGMWTCADPAYVRSEATSARLMACPVDGISPAEADELAAALRPLFGDAGMRLEIDTPSAWCVHPAQAQRGIFTDPADALGVNLIECLPGGETGRTWRRLFNEAQIVLHAHPVNAARIAAGKPPVNALWFWGEGSLPGSVETALHTVASCDEVLRGLVKLAGAVRVEPSQEALEARGVGGDALLDLDAPGDMARIGKWLSPFRRWLRERRFDAIALAFAGGERFRLCHAHRLRFWRRA